MGKCSPACKQVAVFSVGTVLLLVGVLAGLFWSDVVDYIYKTELSLSPTSKGFNMWRETPIPMYFDFYFFNWTNPQQTKEGKEKPHFVQVGPYSFSEKHTRVNISWHPENDSLTYNQIREWQFVPSRSVGSLDDQIVSLNVIAATIANSLKNSNVFLKRAASALMNVEESFAVKKSVREWTFDGYRDRLLDIGSKLKDILNITMPFDKFGWFYARNMSSTYDGVTNLYTGQTNMSRLGFINTWNGMSHTPYYDDKCGDVYGTTGELLPPVIDSKKLPVFATDLGSTISLTRSDKMVEKYGIQGVQFFGDISEFDNGTLYPESKCFWKKDKIMPSGVRDVSGSKFGAPAYVSFPHFFEADPWYLNSVDGLKPNADEHKFFINLEPSTGIPLDVRAQLQINILIEPIEGISMYANVPKVVVPMFFFRQEASLTPEFGQLLKLLINLSSFGTYTFYGIAGIGGLLLALGTIITVRNGWGHDDDGETKLLINSGDNGNGRRYSGQVDLVQ